MDALLFFRDMIEAQKRGEAAGVCSVCSAHPLVLEAAMERAAALGRPLLLEATANQVNQYGGYMGMTPEDFRDMAYGVAGRCGLPEESLILGGDHLGPVQWRGENEAEAMQKAEALIRMFVSAGFAKIHIDTSMHLKDDDPAAPLPASTVARRAARLCKAAEEAAQAAEEAAQAAPVYVIGSEVPPPGGATGNDESISVTTVESLRETIGCFREAFVRSGLEDAWERVIAAVVQPGVEFSDNHVALYGRAAAGELTGYVKAMDSIVLEGHSTDYQPKACLAEMKEDGIAILKVGPALTFALREGLFALEQIERALFHKEPAGGYSGFSEALDAAMLENPAYWVSHYRGTEEEIALKRKYSLSDRCRYYLSEARVAEAIRRLQENLSGGIPLGLLMQYMPRQAEEALSGGLKADAFSLAKAKVREVLDTYD
ncbi:MAG: class II D-tagatose-bisphosphate aldolase, non-catalytic subunit [Clostridiales bacterium]|nr:class II D-tagatose-bisphosphate aldolase, non-catalytic subunit [Clostridiales bacterium]